MSDLLRSLELKGLVTKGTNSNIQLYCWQLKLNVTDPVTDPD